MTACSAAAWAKFTTQSLPQTGKCNTKPCLAKWDQTNAKADHEFQESPTSKSGLTEVWVKSERVMGFPREAQGTHEDILTKLTRMLFTDKAN